MADITLNFNTTAKQDAKLSKVLTSVNAERVQNELPPFADIQTYLRFIVIETVKSYVKRQGEIDAVAIGTAYDEAADSVKATVATALGL